MGKPRTNLMPLKKRQGYATHKIEAHISKFESALDKLRDKNVAAMQRFIADARNQAFRDELSLDLEDGYKDSTYVMFNEVRTQIEEEDLAKNKEGLKSYSRSSPRRSFWL